MLWVGNVITDIISGKLVLKSQEQTKAELTVAKELSELEKKPLQEKNRSSRSKIEEDKPKVNFAENVTSSKIPLQ